MSIGTGGIVKLKHLASAQYGIFPNTYDQKEYILNWLRRHVYIDGSDAIQKLGTIHTITTVTYSDAIALGTSTFSTEGEIDAHPDLAEVDYRVWLEPANQLKIGGEDINELSDSGLVTFQETSSGSGIWKAYVNEVYESRSGANVTITTPDDWGKLIGVGAISTARTVTLPEIAPSGGDRLTAGLSFGIILVGTGNTLTVQTSGTDTFSENDYLGVDETVTSNTFVLATLGKRYVFSVPTAGTEWLVIEKNIVGPNATTHTHVSADITDAREVFDILPATITSLEDDAQWDTDLVTYAGVTIDSNDLEPGLLYSNTSYDYLCTPMGWTRNSKLGQLQEEVPNVNHNAETVEAIAAAVEVNLASGSSFYRIDLRTATGNVTVNLVGVQPNRDIPIVLEFVQDSPARTVTFAPSIRGESQISLPATAGELYVVTIKAAVNGYTVVSTFGTGEVIGTTGSFDYWDEPTFAFHMPMDDRSAPWVIASDLATTIAARTELSTYSIPSASGGWSTLNADYIEDTVLAAKYQLGSATPALPAPGNGDFCYFFIMYAGSLAGTKDILKWNGGHSITIIQDGVDVELTGATLAFGSVNVVSTKYCFMIKREGDVVSAERTVDGITWTPSTATLIGWDKNLTAMNDLDGAVGDRLYNFIAFNGVPGASNLQSIKDKIKADYFP